MAATLLDGRAIATSLHQDIAHRVMNFRELHGYAPGLAVLLVGDNPASHVYVKNKRKSCEQVGIRSDVHILPSTATQGEILGKIDALNMDRHVHGILIQLPLPESLDMAVIVSRIAPHKDVDGLHPWNLGLLFSGRPNLVPCTPLGCLHLIQSVVPCLKGKHAVVVGWSVLVGRPMGVLLGLERATVVQTHSRTVNLAQECQRADVLVCAAGKPGLITANHVKPGAVVIDIGITRVTAPDGTVSLQGDAAFEEVREVAGFLTPVPGGVGPMTVAYLLMNTLSAAENALRENL